MIDRLDLIEHLRDIQRFTEAIFLTIITGIILTTSLTMFCFLSVYLLKSFIGIDLIDGIHLNDLIN